MDILRQLQLCIIAGGGAIALANTVSLIQKNAKTKVKKLANGGLKKADEVKGMTGTDGLIISKNIQLKAKYDYEGICVFGPTGSGKTTSYFLPNLLSNNITGSFIVTDPKGELFNLTSKYQEKICGRKVYRIDLDKPENSARYNLLENCKTSDEVIQLASTLLINGGLSVELATGKKAGGVEWVQMAEPLLASVLLYVKDLKYPYNTIDFAFNLILNLDSGKLKLLLEQSNNIEAMTQFKIFSQVGGADRTEGSIKITLASNMKLWTDKNINKVASMTSFNIDKFRDEPSILYISYPERKSAYYAPFIAPFFSQLTDKLIDNYADDKLPIHLLFDEFGNIGMLNNMSINCATIRSRKISMSICLQSITQLYQVYGRDIAKSILNNLKTKITLPGMNDIDTLDYINKLCGETEIMTSSFSINKNSTSESYQKARRRVFEDGEVRTLEDDTSIVVMNNRQPIIDMQEIYYKDDKYTRNIYSEKAQLPKNYSNNINYQKELDKIREELEVLEMEQEEELESCGQGLFK